jgi:hypothetical protein
MCVEYRPNNFFAPEERYVCRQSSPYNLFAPEAISTKRLTAFYGSSRFATPAHFLTLFMVSF